MADRFTVESFARSRGISVRKIKLNGKDAVSHVIQVKLLNIDLSYEVQVKGQCDNGLVRFSRASRRAGREWKSSIRLLTHVHDTREVEAAVYLNGTAGEELLRCLSVHSRIAGGGGEWSDCDEKVVARAYCLIAIEN